MTLQNMLAPVQTLGNMKTQQMQQQVQQQQMDDMQAAKEAYIRIQQNPQDNEAMATLTWSVPQVAQQLQRQMQIRNEAEAAAKKNSLFAATEAIKSGNVGLFQKSLVEAFGDTPLEGQDASVAQQIFNVYRTEGAEAALDDLKPFAASFGKESYDSLYGMPDQTDFQREMIAAGIEPGSDEFKAAVLERYGKGKTIGYDVIEALNPDTGKVEYFQVSRTDPGDKISLGLEVAPSAQEIKAGIDDAKAAENEMEGITRSLDTLEKLLSSPGLAQVSGMDQFISLIPGTDAASAKAWIGQLKSQNFTRGIENMRGMGALSGKEGDNVTNAIANLDPAMKDADFKQQLIGIQEGLLKAKERIESGRLVNLDGTPKDEDKLSRPALQATEGNKPKTVNWSDL